MNSKDNPCLNSISCVVDFVGGDGGYAFKEEFLRDEERKKIEEIIAGRTCPSNFKCTKEGFECLCRTTEVGLGGPKKLLCEEDRETQKTCTFADWYGGSGAKPHGYFCMCPQRLYLSEKLKK
jgi:hypothetical protein